MSRTNQTHVKSLRSYQFSKSNLSSDVFSTIDDKYKKSQISSDAYSTMDEKFKTADPYLKSHDDSKMIEIDLFRTHDNRDSTFRDSLDNFDNLRNPSKSFADEKIIKRMIDKNEKIKKNTIKGLKIDAETNKILNTQDKIIKMQSSLIEDLKIELKSLKSKNSTLEKLANRESPNILSSENLKLHKKLEEITNQHEKELEKILTGISRKEEIFKEYKLGVKLKLEKKKRKIQMLNEKLSGVKEEYIEFYDNACKNAFESLKKMLEKETKEKLKIEEELLTIREREKVYIEENNMLVQNYEDIKKQCNDLEIQLSSANRALSLGKKFQDNRIKADDYLMHLNSLTQQNKVLVEKCRNLADKNLDFELEIKKLKSQLTESYETNTVKTSSEVESLKSILKKKTKKIETQKEEIAEVKRKLKFLQDQNSKLMVECRTNLQDENPEYFELLSKIPLLEEKINLLKTENVCFKTKEEELKLALANSEKGRSYYQEQTISLKENLHTLETQLRNIESSFRDWKSRDESPKLLKSRGQKTKSTKDLKKLLKDWKKSI